MEEKNFLLFEDYLSQNLTEAQLQGFNTKLLNDVEFKQAFNLYKDATQHLQHEISNAQDISDFKANLDVISNNYFDTYLYNETVPQNEKTSNRLKYLIAACVLLMLGFFVTQQFNTPSYYDYNTFETLSLTERSTNTQAQNNAQRYFNTKKYNKAIAAFNVLLKAQPNNTEIQYHKAIALIETNAYNNAKTVLLPIINGTSVYKHKAKWLLALSYLKQDNIPQTVSVLKTIPKDAEVYSKAKALLNKLE